MSRVMAAFKAHEAALRRLLARYFKSAADVEDALQETFLRAFAAEIKGPVREPRAFLFTVAKHTALHEIERKSFSATDSMEAHGGVDSLSAPDRSGPEHGCETRRQLLEFTQALATLTPRCREVFVLHKVHGLKLKDVARELGISVSAVEKHIATGLLHFCRHFRERGYDAADLGPVAQRLARHLDAERAARDNKLS